MNGNLKVRLQLRSNRRQTERYQVRIWAEKQLYLEFKKSCKAQGLTVTEAFDEFLKWAVKP